MLYLLWVLLHNAVALGRSGAHGVLPLELPPEPPTATTSGACIGHLFPSRGVWCRFGDAGVDLAERTEGALDDGNHILLITLDGRKRRPRRLLRQATADGPDDHQKVRPQTVFVVPDALLLLRASAEHRRSGLKGLLQRLGDLLWDPEQLREEGEGWHDWCERTGTTAAL